MSKTKKKSVLKLISKVILDYLREDALIVKPLDESVTRLVNTKRRKPKKVK